LVSIWAGNHKKAKLSHP